MISSRNIFIATTILVVLVASYVWFNRKHDGDESKIEPPSTVQETVTKRPPFPEPRTPPEGFKEYRSVFYRFQFFYPEQFTVSEKEIPTSAILLTFSANSGKSFEVFIVPHGDPGITDHRIEQDLASGQILSPEEMHVDDVVATVFVDSDPESLDTFEVWFVNKGFLYEVSAPVESKSMLLEMLTSWMFL